MSAPALSLFHGAQFRIVIPGAPRTKKTSNQAMRTGPECQCCHLKSGPILVAPSANWRKWLKEVQRAFGKQSVAVPGIDFDVSCRALIYREIASGDSHGFYQGLADVLEKVGVIKNDRLIKDWDGSRLLKDPKFPRTEVTLTAL